MVSLAADASSAQRAPDPAKPTVAETFADNLLLSPVLPLLSPLFLPLLFRRKPSCVNGLSNFAQKSHLGAAPAALQRKQIEQEAVAVAGERCDVAPLRLGRDPGDQRLANAR